MSKPREIWWSYAKAMIRQFPALHEEYLDLHSQNVTANMSGMPGSGSASRTVENVALRSLPAVKQREHDAVMQAIDITRQMETGEERMKLVDLVYWKRQYTLEGAAMQINCSVSTALRYHGQFVHLVGNCAGLKD